MMTSANQDLTRREFMLVSAAAVAAPLLTDLSGLVPEAKAVEEAKADKKGNIDHIDPKCNGCQVCTIFFSNCLILNNRRCWCEPAGGENGEEDRA
jgi:hypothetical protein